MTQIIEFLLKRKKKINEHSFLCELSLRDEKI